MKDDPIFLRGWENLPPPIIISSSDFCYLEDGIKGAIWVSTQTEPLTLNRKSLRLQSSEIFFFIFLFSFFFTLLIFMPFHSARGLLLEKLLNVFTAFIRLIGLKKSRFNSHVGLRYLKFSSSNRQGSIFQDYVNNGTIITTILHTWKSIHNKSNQSRPLFPIITSCLDRSQ